MSSRTKELQLSVLMRPCRFVDLFVKFPGFHSSFYCKILGPVFRLFPVWAQRKRQDFPRPLQTTKSLLSSEFCHGLELWLRLSSIFEAYRPCYFRSFPQALIRGSPPAFLRGAPCPHCEGSGDRKDYILVFLVSSPSLSSSVWKNAHVLPLLHLTFLW